MSRIGAVVVSYNSEAELGRCLDSIPPEIETIVVDNASIDGSRSETLRRGGVRLIENPWNRGFGAAANQGISALNCESVLLLNPDVELLSDIGPLAGRCAEPGVGAAGAKLVDGNGAAQKGFMVRRLPTPWTLAFEVTGLNRIWPGNPVNRSYRCFDLDPDAACDVQQPPGALLMIRREAWQRVGGFDESFYPVWFEDVDFAGRLAAAGYRVCYEPVVTAKHAGAHSVGRLSPVAKCRYWYGNLLRYVGKHFTPPGFWVVCTALVLGSIFRAVTDAVSERSLEPFSDYYKIIRSACREYFSRRAGELHFSSALVGR